MKNVKYFKERGKIIRKENVINFKERGKINKKRKCEIFQRKGENNEKRKCERGNRIKKMWKRKRTIIRKENVKKEIEQ